MAGGPAAGTPNARIVAGPSASMKSTIFGTDCENILIFRPILPRFRRIF
jgi:hypothetical protein